MKQLSFDSENLIVLYNTCYENHFDYCSRYKMFLNEYTNTAIDISIICESKALEVFYLKSLVSPATIVTVIGIRELLVRIVTSIG